jgi:hypothetical protein
LVLVIGSLGVPQATSAQSTAAAQAGISGRAVDAGGRGLASQRIELVQNGAVVSTTTTGSRGDYSFAGIPAGEYVVRTSVNGMTAGSRVVVAQGQTASALIVAPSAAAPSGAFLAALGLLGTSLTVGAVVTAIVTTAVVVSGS